MTTLVTGASGFVGTALCARLGADGLRVRGAVRTLTPLQGGTDAVAVGSISPNTDWASALKGVDTVVHLAARVHVMNDTSADPLAEFRRVNVEATANLARQAAAAGVRRLVYLSSIKVNGEFTVAGHPFTAADAPGPQDPYGVSKHEAEQVLRRITAETGMQVVIIRPPLVYGPGVKANFDSMMRWLARGVPLPLAALTNNRRSLVALDNLVDLIVTCLSHPAAANQTFLVSDGADVSTAELLTRLGHALGKPARLFHISSKLLQLGAALTKRDAVFQRLCGSLQVDIAHTQQLLNWKPPVPIDEALRAAAQGLRV